MLPWGHVTKVACVPWQGLFRSHESVALRSELNDRMAPEQEVSNNDLAGHARMEAIEPQASRIART